MISKQQQSEPKSPTSSFDWLKWTLIVILVAAGVWANFHYSSVDWALRLAGWIVLACVLLWIALQTSAGRAIWRFFKESRAELRKVVWPTRKETSQTTLIVIVMVIVMSLILWGLDSFLMWVVSLLTG